MAAAAKCGVSDGCFSAAIDVYTHVSMHARTEAPGTFLKLSIGSFREWTRLPLAHVSMSVRVVAHHVRASGQLRE